MDLGDRKRMEQVFEVAEMYAWAKIVPDNLIAFPPSMAVTVCIR